MSSLVCSLALANCAIAYLRQRLVLSCVQMYTEEELCIRSLPRVPLEFTFKSPADKKKNIQIAEASTKL